MEDVSAIIRRIIRDHGGQELRPGSVPEDRLRTDSGNELNLLGIIGGKAVWAPSSELGIVADTSVVEAALAAHLADGAGAHDSSAITYAGGAAGISSTDVEGAIDELDAEKQPKDTDLTTIAGLTATTDNFMQAKGSAWASRTVAQVVTDLVAGGMLTSATAASTYLPLAGGILTGDTRLTSNTGRLGMRTAAGSSNIIELAAISGVGVLRFGDGAGVTDVTLSRSGAAAASLDGALAITGALTAGSADLLGNLSVNHATSSGMTLKVAGTSFISLLATSTTATFRDILSSRDVWKYTASTGLLDFTGNTSVTVPTPSTSDSSTKAASTAYVKAQRMSDLTLPNAAVPMNTNKFTGLAAGSADGDSLRYEQLFTTGTVTLLGNLKVPTSKSVVVGTSAGTDDQVTVGFGSVSSWKNGDAGSRMALTQSELYFGSGATGTPDWMMSRTAANEVTVGTGDVIKHDTAAEGSANTVSANTAYVDRAVGSVNMARPAVRALATTTTQSIPNVTTTAIAFPSSDAFDTDAMHDPSTNNTRITIVTPGTYVLQGTAQLAASAGGTTRILLIRKNGSAAISNGQTKVEPMASDTHRATSVIIDQAVAGDYYELCWYQDSGGALAMPSADAHFSAAWVGGTGAAWGSAAVKASIAGTQSIPNNTTTAVALSDADTFDTDVMHDTVTNNTRVTIKTAGTYIFSAAAAMASNATGIRIIVIRKNGTTDLGHQRGIADTLDVTRMMATTIDQAVVGDYYELCVFQNSGGALAMASGPPAFLSAVRVGYQTNPTNAFRPIDSAVGRNTIVTTGHYLTRDGSSIVYTAAGAMKSFIYIDPADYGASSIRVKLRVSVMTETDPTDHTLNCDIYRATAFAGGALTGAVALGASVALAPNATNSGYQGVSAEVTLSTAGWYGVAFIPTVNPAQVATYGYQILARIA